MTIRKAAPADAPRVAPLFDQYRQFYREAADPAGCLDYISRRLERGESIIYLAESASAEVMGFTQLYPSFCSVAMGPLVYLYDLYVAPAFRRRGVAEALMMAAREHALGLGAVRISLETQQVNLGAQALYEKLGYRRDEEFHSYHLALN